MSIVYPASHMLTFEDVRPVLAMSHAVETHNQARTGVNRAETWPFLDEMFDESTQLSAVTADDAHFKHPLGLPGTPSTAKSTSGPNA